MRAKKQQLSSTQGELESNSPGKKVENANGTFMSVVNY